MACHCGTCGGVQSTVVNLLENFYEPQRGQVRL